MKKLLAAILVLSLLLSLALCSASADDGYADYTCKEQNFSTKIPLSGTSGYEGATRMFASAGSNPFGNVAPTVVSVSPASLQSRPTSFAEPLTAGISKTTCSARCSTDIFPKTSATT